MALNRTIWESGSSLLEHSNHESRRRARLYKREGVVLIRSEGIINVPSPSDAHSPSLVAKSFSFPSLTSGALEVFPTFPTPRPNILRAWEGTVDEGEGTKVDEQSKLFMSLTNFRSVMFQGASSVVLVYAKQEHLSFNFTACKGISLSGVICVCLGWFLTALPDQWFW